VGMTARGGTAKIKSMTVIEMKPISPDRMTA
jgi:hypothetical protein